MDSINNACKLGSDAWLELQAFKTRQLNRREKLNRHKNLHKDLINGITSQSHQPQTQNHASSSSSSSTSNNNAVNPPIANQDLSSSRIAAHQKSSTSTSSPHNVNTASHELGDAGQSSSHINIGPGASITDATNRCGGVNKIDLHDTQPYTVGETSADTSASSNQLVTDQSVNLELVECLLLLKLCDVALKLPIDSKSLQRSICRIRALARTPLSLIENLLQKFAHQELITIEEPAPALANRQKTQPIRSADVQTDDEPCIYVTLADHTKLVEFDKSYSSREDIQALLVESKSDDLVNGDEQDSVPIQSIRSSSSSASSSHLHDKDDSSVKHKSDIHNDARQQRNSIETNVSETKSAYSSANSKLDSTNSSKAKKIQAGDDLESLLSLSSTRERESKKLGEELLELLSKPTAKERNLLERFRSSDGYQVQEFCPKGTKGECIRNNNGGSHCDKLHFKKIIAKHTEESLGDCSFLNTCFHMDSCKYVHYEVDYGERIPQQNQFKRPAEPNQRRRDDHIDPTASTPTADKPTSSSAKDVTKSNAPQNMAVAAPGSSGPFLYKLSHEEQARIDAKNRKRFKTVLYPPQWIQCDLRFFDMSLLGKFSVVMADPPWDIHMELPYGTMSDEEMRKLNIPALQDEGVIFLWVTGRAMELGRECLALWGYERCDEIIWVKTNQLQRIIRTGRTGHWLNHGKEHCLVGVKGKPKDMNRGLDCDVIVAEVRATSHKPDEIYGIIERLSPGTRKIELFGRAHNVQPNWITLGNQLNGVRLIEQSLIGAFKKLNIPFQTADD